MFKKAISTVKPMTVFMATAALLIGCSKGGNVPKEWDKDGVGTSRKKLECASPNTFSANAVNVFRADKLAQMKTFNIEQNQDAQNPLLVIRTILTDLPNYKDVNQLPSENLLLLPEQQGSMPEHQASRELIVAEKINCDQLTGKYRGPGVNSEMIGKLKSISEKSIEIEGTDASGALITVKVEKTVVNRKKDPAGFQKAQQQEENGFTELTVTISRKLNGQDLTGAVIIQKTGMNIDEEIKVNPSVIRAMQSVVGAENISPGITQKLNAAQAQTAGLKAVDATTVTLTFSELMSLKNKAIEMRNMEEVNVTSKQVPLVVIDEIKEDAAAPAAGAPSAAAAPVGTVFPVINPDLSKDSFLQRYLQEVIDNARKEENIQFDITAEAAGTAGAEDSDAADAAAAADADASAGQDAPVPAPLAAPAADAPVPAPLAAPAADAPTESQLEKTTQDTQKTKVPVTATGKIIST